MDEAFAPALKAHPAMRVADRPSLDALAERVGPPSGFPVIWDAALGDAPRFHSQDPWGNRIELLAVHLGAVDSRFSPKSESAERPS